MPPLTGIFQLFNITLAIAATIPKHLFDAGPVHPKVKGTPQVVGVALDPSLHRDSCGSARFGSRALWVCRDTLNVDSDGLPALPMTGNSASWSDFMPDGAPSLQAIGATEDIITINTNNELLLYGDNNNKSFYPLAKDECNDNEVGRCNDGSRWTLWPDSPPMVSTTQDDGTIIAYTWVVKDHIKPPDLAPLLDNPATSLYRVSYNPKQDGTGAQLPQVEFVQEEFWGDNEVPYGSYGRVIHDGMAYLYGQTFDDTIALARVPANKVEDKGRYEYFVDGAWTPKMPTIQQSGINLDNTAGGQGTFHWFEHWQSYGWIGGGKGPGASFYITTAPEPWGPWTEPVVFYEGEVGNYTLGAYSLQAHPALLPNPSANEMYLSYTKVDVVKDCNIYTQPLILVEWQ